MSIIEKVWDYDFDPGTNLVDVYIKRLRSKIEHEDGSKPLIQSIRGVGYRMRDVPTDDDSEALSAYFRYAKTIPSLFMVNVSPSTVPVVMPAPCHFIVSFGPSRV